MNATITLTALQARRALALARWMQAHGGNLRTRRECRDLAQAIVESMSEAGERTRLERLAKRRKAWRDGTRAYRDRQQATEKREDRRSA